MKALTAQQWYRICDIMSTGFTVMLKDCTV